MFCEKLTEEQIRKVMNVISDDGALTILKIRTYDKSFEDAVAVSAVPEVTAKFQEDIETYQLHDYFIRGKNRAGAGSDYIYRKMMYEWFGAVCCKISDGILRGNGYVCKKTQG